MSSMSTIHSKDGVVPDRDSAANGGGELPQPLELLRELREAEEMLQAKEIQVAALKAMKKREEQVKLLERTTRRTLSLHLDGWRRVVAEARSERLLKEKDAEIDRLLKAPHRRPAVDAGGGASSAPAVKVRTCSCRCSRMWFW